MRDDWRHDNLPVASRGHRPRNRRSPLFSAIVLLAPAPIAAWIVFANDLPTRISAWIHRDDVAAKDKGFARRSASPSLRTRQPEPSARSPRQASTPVAPSEFTEPQATQIPYNQTVAPPRVERQPGRLPEESPAPAAPAIAHDIKLDLDVRRIFHRLDEVSDLRLRIVELAGCDAPYALTPETGDLDETHPATIVIEGPRPVTIALSIRARNRTEPVIVVEPTVKTDDGRTIAFTLKHLRDYRRDVEKSREQAGNALAVMIAHRDELNAYIQSPHAKPLAARGEARTQLARLDREVPAGEKLVAALAQNLLVADEMIAFATALHEGCRIKLAAAAD
jgi:hypothetical protein